MPDVLVVFHSRTGHCRDLARLMSEQRGWALAEVAWPGKQPSYTRCATQAILRGHPAIRYQGPDPAAYDVVVLVSPVWCWRLCPPMRSFIRSMQGKLGRVAVLSCMGGSGEYVAFVGHTTARSHMRWATAAYERAKQKYPKIVRISEPVESAENLETVYQKAKELLAKHPNLKGFEGSSVVDLAGIGRAVREAGIQGRTCVVGTSLPSVAGEFLTDGAVDKIFLWDPQVAGQAQCKLALMLIKGEKIGPGLDLGLPGYRNLKRIPGTPHALAGSGWIMIDKSNAAQYPF